jgi:hypothetical protein
MEQKKPLENWLIVIVSTILLIFIFAYAVTNPEKRSSETIIMTLLSLFGAGFTLFFTGKMKLEGKLKVILVEAGGSLAVFFLLFYFLVATKGNPNCENLTNLKEEIVLFKRDLENSNKNLENSKSQEQDLDRKGDIGKRQIIIEANIRKCESILIPRLSREIEKCNSGSDNRNEYNAVYNEFQQLKSTAN